MKKWLKEHKLGVILSSVVTLLPMLFGVVFWNQLPEVITTHWGADGVADDFAGKALAVFLVPGILFLLNILCVCVTALDRRNREQSPKVTGMLLWIFPIISLTANGIVYAVAFEQNIEVVQFMPVLMGVLFVVMGNYMPKTKRNRTIGVKISWTMNNEENWNKTHRLTGKLWVAGGLVLIAGAFLPVKWMVSILVGVLLAMCLVPFLYSYWIYRRHKKQGIEYKTADKSKAEKIAIKVSAVIVPLILIGCAVLLFTGEVEVQFQEDGLIVDTTYWNALSVDYDAIDSVEYLEDLDIGFRVSGVGSARLSAGNFENDVFGKYTLYSYNGCDAMVIVKSQGKVLAFNAKDEIQTYAIYQSLLEKVNQ